MTTVMLFQRCLVISCRVAAHIVRLAVLEPGDNMIGTAPCAIISTNRLPLTPRSADTWYCDLQVRALQASVY